MPKWAQLASGVSVSRARLVCPVLKYRHGPNLVNACNTAADASLPLASEAERTLIRPLGKFCVSHTILCVLSPGGLIPCEVCTAGF